MAEHPHHPWATVHAPSGTFLTVPEEGLVRARGIRYAASERFGAPRPYAYQEPFRAETPAPACPQEYDPLRDVAVQELGTDEHAQRLSITRPGSPEKDLPVVVWFHGGSYKDGAGDFPHYDPRALVQEQNLVFVAVTYRLGLFGYLGDGTSRSANPGLLDMVQAVQWVHRNIEAFGGDPERVTLMGQSAGAHAVWDMLHLSELRGTFSRAIMQSPPLGIVHGRAKSWPHLVPPAAETDRLRQLPAQELAELRGSVYQAARRHSRARFMPFSPQYTDPLPSEEQLEQTWAQAAGEVEILIGTTAREVGLFAGGVPVLRRLFRHRLGRALVVEPLVRFLTRGIYRKDVERWVRLFRQAGGRAGMYTMTFGSRENILSCGHVTDLPLLFPHPVWDTAHAELGSGITTSGLVSTYPPERRAEVGRELRAVWGAFARGGLQDPGVKEITGALELD